MTGTERHPATHTGLARAMCHVAAALLPDADRERYAQEWRADIDADPQHATAYAGSILVDALPLSLTLTGRLAPERPLLCQLGHHRYVTVHDNPENMRFTSHQCARCGHVEDDWRGTEQTVVKAYAWGNAPGTLR